MTFLEELKRRHVYRVAAAYVVVGWLLIQVVTQVFPIFHLPDRVDQVIVLLILIGFPIALVLAWAFDATPQGIVPTGDVSPDDAATSPAPRRSHRAGVTVGLIGVLIAVIAGFAWWHFERRRPPAASPAHVASTPATHAVPAKSPATRQPSAVSTAAPAAPIAAQAIPAKSVAVLPFENDSGQKDQQYFSDGLSQDLITALTQFGGLKVISRDSSFQFRNSKDSPKLIAAKLGVAHLLEDSVQKLGNEVRVSAELVNCADGSTLWSQHYDRPYKDLFALQDDITKSVAAALKAKLLDSGGTESQSDRPPSGNLAAYNAYLQGQFHYQRGSEVDLHEALAQFAKATKLDPDYAAAFAATSQAWILLGGYFLDVADKPHAYAEARTWAETALRLNPDLAVAHVANGSVLNNADFNWNGAQAEYRRALKLAPGNADALFSRSTMLAALGHTSLAIRDVDEALARNPLNTFWHDWLASCLAALGRFNEAEAAARVRAAATPQLPGVAYVEVMKGDAKDASAAAQNVPAGRNHDIAMAWALQLGSDRAAADVALQTLIDKHAGDSSYQIAEVYALRRDPDNMFKWLDQAWTNRDDGIQYLLYDPIILRYRNDPRFAAFCRKVGLPTTTDAMAMR
ncbi:MAG: hypothetical protein ACREPK_04715 [Rhodanobacteraceae bacterium]